MVHSHETRLRSVICYLTENQSESLEERSLHDLVKKHSDFISFPVELCVEKQKEQKDDSKRLCEQFSKNIKLGIPEVPNLESHRASSKELGNCKVAKRAGSSDQALQKQQNMHAGSEERLDQ
eukprot:6858659-Karenia_brevis.AAC.1